MWQAINDLQLFDFGLAVLLVLLVLAIMLSVEVMFPRRRKK